MVIFGLALACLLGPLSAWSPLKAGDLTLNAGSESYKIGITEIQHFADAGAALKIEDVRGREANRFQQPKTLSFGYSNNAHWAKFRVNNQRSEREFLLEVSYPVMDKIDVYVFGGPRPYHTVQGDAFPFSARDVPNRNFVFRLPLAPGKTSEVYIRVHTQSAAALPLKLYTRDAFASKDHLEQSALMLYYGAIIIMILYNISLFVYLRDTSYLYYVLYILSISMVLAVQNGIAYEFLWSNAVWWNGQAQHFTVFMAALFVTVFCRSFLRTSETLPLMNRVLFYFAGIVVVAVSASFVMPTQLSLRLASLLAALSALMGIGTGIVVMARGFVVARFYVLAWTLFLLGAILAALRNFGVLPHNNLTTYGLQIGQALEVLLLSFGLGYRINLLREEKEQEKADIARSVARFVPTEFLNYLGAKDIRQINFGEAVEQDFTVLFTDIRSFTSLSENMSVQDNFKFLNSYLKRMVPIIHQHNGFIDKFIGDAILALFPGTPVTAVRSAVDMRRELMHYNDFRVNTQGYPAIDTGTGLHMGKLMLGTVGFDKKALTDIESMRVPDVDRERLDTTVIGDTVNVSARLQDLTKNYGAPLLISESVFSHLPPEMRETTRLVDHLRMRGKNTRIRVYEVFEADANELKEQKLITRTALEEAIQEIVTLNFGAALQRFQELQKQAPADPLMEFYIGRCRKLIDMGG